MNKNADYEYTSTQEVLEIVSRYEDVEVKNVSEFESFTNIEIEITGEHVGLMNLRGLKISNIMHYGDKPGYEITAECYGREIELEVSRGDLENRGEE